MRNHPAWPRIITGGSFAQGVLWQAMSTTGYRTLVSKYPITLFSQSPLKNLLKRAFYSAD